VNVGVLPAAEVHRTLPDAPVPAVAGSANGTSARALDPTETLSLVVRAAETVRTVQSNADLIGGRARDLLRMVALERGRMQAEMQDLQRALAESEERAAEAEIRLQNANLRAWNEGIRRGEAEAREQQTLRRAEEAERRCDELEQLFFQIRARLIPALAHAGVT